MRKTKIKNLLIFGTICLGLTVGASFNFTSDDFAIENQIVTTQIKNRMSYKVSAHPIILENLTISGISDQTYTGEPITPEPALTYTLLGEPITLVKDTDYKLSYLGNIEPGTSTIGIEFINDYSGSTTTTFKIVAVKTEDITIELDNDSYVFSGFENKPTPTVSFKNGLDSKTIPANEYSVRWLNNVEPGQGTVEVTFNNSRYASPATKAFAITKASANNLTINLEKETYAYTRSVVQPTIESVMLGDYLVPDDQYTVDYDNNIDATTEAEVIIEMKDGMAIEGSKTKLFTIAGKDITQSVIIDPVPDVTFTGLKAEPHTHISEDGVDLMENTDYEISSEDINAGDATAKIHFINNYAGTSDKYVSFVIKPKIVVEDVDIIVGSISDHTFDCKEYTPEPSVTLKPDIALNKGTDFVYEYENNTHIPGGKVIIKFINNYEGSNPIERTFNINPKAVDDPTSTLTFIPSATDYPDQEFTGSTINPEMKIYDGEHELVKGVDFTIASTCKDIGAANFTIAFDGDYKGSNKVQVSYLIVPGEYDIYIPNTEYTGTIAEPKPIIRYHGNILIQNEDFTASSTDINTGPATCHIEFGGIYTGTPAKDLPFKILPAISDDLTAEINTQSIPYTGNEIKPDIIVKDNDKVLTKDIDYQIIYTNNILPGKGKAYVLFIGNYVGNEPISTEFIIKATKLDNRTSDTSSPTVILENPSGFDSDVSLSVTIKNNQKVKEEGRDLSFALGRFYATYGSYDIKLYKNGKEIQPSDLGEGIILTLRIALPDNLKGSTIRLIHIHGDEEVSEIVPGDKIGVGTYIVDEEGFIVTQLTKLSDFSIAAETQCFAHWFLLTIAVLDAILLLALFMLGKKPNKTVGVVATSWLIVLTAVIGAFAHCGFCYAMIAIDCLLIVGNVFFFMFYKKDDKEDKENNNTVTYIQVPVKEEPKPQEEKVEEQPKVEESPKEEVAIQETPVVQEEALKEEPVVEEDLSLKESMAQAKETVADVEINKQTVADFLKENYQGKVIVGDVKPGMTSTGLPLADTHYIVLGENNKKCFIYVYDVDGKCFFIVRGDEQIAADIKGLNHKFIRSAFPKTRDYAKWYTMLIDDSYKSSEEVFNALRMVIANLRGERIAPAPVMEESISLKESMAKAKEAVVDVAINKKTVCEWLEKTYGNKVRINTRDNMTSTGLPLGDTHYTNVNGQEKCFIYVYELDGKCFFIVRSNDEMAKVVRSNKHKFIPSAFPKTRDYAKWYTMLIDDSYANGNEVFETLKTVLDDLMGLANGETLSLKESMAQAKTIESVLNMNKEVVAKYLKENYQGKVIVGDVKPGMTSTGLPLADTHYIVLGENNKKCFIYVYDVDGKCFFIVRSNDDTAKLVKENRHKFIQSAFPKTRDYAKWYTMLIDNTYSSNEEVFESLDIVIKGLLEK